MYRYTNIISEVDSSVQIKHLNSPLMIVKLDYGF